MENPQLPNIGQALNLISVHAGQVHVYGMSVLASDVSGMTLSVNANEDEPCFETGAVVTLQYQCDGAQWRGRGVVHEVNGGQVSLAWKGAATRGENRDFIRAVVEVPVFAGPLGSSDIEAALVERDANSISGDSSAWKAWEVDLSGNGAKFDWDAPVSKGDWVDFRVKLPFSTGDEILALLGRVVRVQGKDQVRSVALYFEGIEESVQDLLFDYVSARYHAQIQVALAAATHELDAS